MQFSKYHALGNDYIVIEESVLPADFDEKLVRRICHRNYGVGGDGILAVRSTSSAQGGFSVKIYNPDGSEAEKSGNGLRIVARYLWDREKVGTDPFPIDTAGGRAECRVRADGRELSVRMGKASFWSEDIPVTGPPREVLRESLNVDGLDAEFTAVSVGNPHCVLFRQTALKDEALAFGPLIERHNLFPNRINVQFAQVISDSEIKIEIWERGAGYTLASGTSSCAVAAAARKLGLCGAHVRIHTPGGILLVEIADDYELLLTGPVTRVASGELYAESLA